MKLHSHWKRLMAFSLFLLGLALYQTVAHAAPTAEPKQKGAAIIAYYQGQYRQMDGVVTELANAGADWLSVYVTIYQDTIDATTITRTRAETPTEGDLAHIIGVAHNAGLKVMLKPQINLLYDDAHWHGQIGQNFTNEAQWQAWFQSYTAVINHYAEVAATNGVEQYSVGTELTATAHRASNWRALITSVRNRYTGKILYTSNHSGEETSITWWDAVDLIGLAAYYEVGRYTGSSVAQLKAGWAPVVQTLNTLAARHNKPIIFVEVGYRSVTGATQFPWCYLCTGAVNLQEQANGYQALYESVWNQPWFGGLYWWRWDIDATRSGPCDNGYSPYNKPAENVMRSWYGAATRSIPTTCGGPAATATPTLPPTVTSTATPPRITLTPLWTPTTTPVVPTATATPVTTPATTGVVYDDALAAGWQNWSWGTVLNFASANVVHNGNTALAATYASGWGGLYLQASSPLAVEPTSKLHFWLRGSATGQVIDLWLVRPDGGQSARQRMTAPPGTWQEFSVPISAFGNLTAISGIVWQEGSGMAKPVFYLDEIALHTGNGSPTATPPPTATVLPTATPTYALTPTPTPGAGGSNVTNLYDERIDANWVNWSWSSTLHPTASTAHSGVNGLGVTYTSGWGGLYLAYPNQLTVDSSTELHFWIYGNGRPLDLKVDTGGAPTGVRVRIQPPAGQWTAVTIPLSSFGNVTIVRGLIWQDGAGAAQPPYYLDEIVLRRSAATAGPRDSKGSPEIITERNVGDEISDAYVRAAGVTYLPLVAND
jgi:hypothetical protein